jgi:hypothetical protein
MVHIEEQSNTHIKNFFQPVHENFFLSDDQTMETQMMWFDNEDIAPSVLFGDSNDVFHNNDEFGEVQT